MSERRTPSLFADISYCLPDGLECHWSYAKENVSEDVLQKKAYELADQTQQLRQETRICNTNRASLDHVGVTLRNTYPQLEINWGGNKFFEIQLTDNTPSHFDQERFEIHQLTSSTDPMSDTYLDFLLGSFGTTEEKQAHIQSNFDKALHDPTNQCFIIVSKDEALAPVGVFTTKYIPELEEVQLHSVAARRTRPTGKEIKPALPILMSALMQTVIDNYSHEGKFEGVKRITFSASGAAPLYKVLGISTSDRVGMSIKALL